MDAEDCGREAKVAEKDKDLCGSEDIIGDRRLSKTGTEWGDESKLKRDTVAVVGEEREVLNDVENEHGGSSVGKVEGGGEKTEGEQNVLKSSGRESEPGFPMQKVIEDVVGEEKSIKRSLFEIEDEANLLRNGEREEESVAIDRVERKDELHLSLGYSKENGSYAVTCNNTQDKSPESVATKTEIAFKEMSVKEDPLQSPCRVLQQISGEAAKVAGEALQRIYFSGPGLSPTSPPGHRRTQSEIGTFGRRRTNSLQRLKMQMQKAWRGVSNSQEDCRPSFNPEILANQKRQWLRLHSSKTTDNSKYKEPIALFEHFMIVGLHPETNMEAVEAAFVRRKKWDVEMANCEVDMRMLTHHGPQVPPLDAQILFKYPPGKKLVMRPKDLAAFCFPGGVKETQFLCAYIISLKHGCVLAVTFNFGAPIYTVTDMLSRRKEQARIVERTPSLSDLNELVYGQEHLSTDDSSFIFMIKVGDNPTLYGVCLHVSEMVQRPPAILHTSSPLCQSSEQCSRYLVSAPRCYCLLTRVPFFELHFEMLNSIIAQERLNRITEFVSEITFASSESSPSSARHNSRTNGNADHHRREDQFDWMASAVRVDEAITLTAAAAGFLSEDEISPPSLKMAGPHSDALDMCHIGVVDRDRRSYDNTSEASYSLERSNEGYETAQASPDIRPSGGSKGCEGYENAQNSPDAGTIRDCRSRTLERLSSSESLLSSARSVVSDDCDESNFSNSEPEFGDDLIMEWARDNKNELLQIVCGYHQMPIPNRGSNIVFHPLEHLQAIEYTRPPVSALGLSDDYLNHCEASELEAKFAAAEEALALSIWATATICRVLSLDTILLLLAGVLLEKQVVVICPNLGVLSSTVLSLIPMIQPFQWQSLLLPVLPGRMSDFLDAPVPYLVGIQNKPTDLKIKTSNLIQVNVLYDRVKMCHLPSLPRRKELMAQLGPIHAKLAQQGSVATRQPVYRCNEAQVEGANQFLTVMRKYMESLCSDLRSHTITSVQSNNDRVSLLLKDSFIDSFPYRDRPFIKLLVDTQLFSVLSDSRLSSVEHGRA